MIVENAIYTDAVNHDGRRVARICMRVLYSTLDQKHTSLKLLQSEPNSRAIADPLIAILLSISQGTENKNTSAMRDIVIDLWKFYWEPTKKLPCRISMPYP
jgi:hypothetical protein